MEKAETINKRYKVLEQLGSGGMGQVLLVSDNLARPPKRLALKTLQIAGKTGQSTDLAWVENFKREFAILAELNHPLLVRVYEFSRNLENNQPFFTSDFIDGQDLFKATRGLNLANQLKHLIMVCEALGFIHREGIIHGDLKPTNIMVDRKTEHPILLDFGLSNWLDQTQVNPNGVGSNIYGTPHYLAPELFSNRQKTIASDLYALGMIFFKIFAGKLPHESKNTSDIIQVNLKSEFQKPSAYSQKIPKELDHLILKLLNKNPSLRFDTAEAIRQSLIDILAKRSTKNYQKPFSNDIQIAFTRSNKIYGKTAEHLLIIKNLDKYLEVHNTPSEDTISLSTPELSHERKPPPLICIQGVSGSGKSFLTKKIHLHYQTRTNPVILFDGAHYKQSFALAIFLLEQLRSTQSIPDEQSNQLNHLLDFLEDSNSESVDLRYSDRQTFFYELSDLLYGMFEQACFTVACDHVELMDDLSVDFLSYLIKQNENPLQPKGIPIILAGNLSGILQGLDNPIGLLSINLNPLSTVDFRNMLLDTFAPQNVTEEIVHFFEKTSTYNPGFLQEIVHDLIREAQISRNVVSWDFSEINKDLLTVNFSYEKLLQNKLDALKDNERKIVEWLAIWNAPINPVEIAKISQISVDQVTRILKHLHQRQLFSVNNRDEYWFEQNILVQMVRDQARSRPAMHARCASYLSEKGDAPFYQLAWHYRGSKNHRKSFEVARKAAESAARIFAYRDAAKYFQLALEEHKNLKEQKGPPMDCLLGLARAYWRMGDRKQSLETYNEIRQTQNVRQNPQAIYEAYRFFAISQRDRGELDACLKTLKEALTLHDPTPADWQGEFRIQEANVFRLKRNLKAAGLSAKKALAVIQNPKASIEKKISILISGSNLYSALNELQKSKDLCQKALDLAKKANDQRRAAVALGNLAAIYAKRRQLIDAERFFDQSIQLFLSVGDTVGLANSRYLYGNLLFLKGAYQEALQQYRDTLNILIGLENYRLLFQVTLNICQIEIALGNFHAAQINLQQANLYLKHLPEEPNNFNYGLVRLKLHLATGNLKGFKKTLNIFAETKQNLNQDLKTILTLLHAQYFKQKGELNQALDALYTIYPDANDIENPDQPHATQWILQLIDCLLASQNGDLVPKFMHILRNITDNSYENNISLQKAMFTAKLALKQNDESTVKDCVQTIEQHLPLTQDFSLTWQTQAILADLWFHLGQHKQAHQALNRAHDLIVTCADKLSQAEASLFLQIPEIAALLKRFERAQQSSPLIVEELMAAKKVIKIYQQIARINTLLVSTWQSPDELLHEIVRSVLALFSAHRGFIVIKENNQFGLASAITNNPDEKWEPNNQYSLSIVEQVILSNQTKRVSNALTDQKLSKQKSVVDLKLRSILAAPIVFQKKILGVIYIDNDQEIDFFSKRDESYLQTFANQIALAIINAQERKKLQESTQEVTSELIRSQQIMREQSKKLERRFQYNELIGGRDPAMQAVFDVIDRVASSDASILIEGETGTGKELIAQAIHYNSPRKHAPFMAINCAALGAELLESELFGHTKGAFTGATTAKHGLFFLANGGTLFLDEIADLNIELQPKLLRAIQEREIMLIGGSKAVPIDIRIVAAANRSLEHEVGLGLFRSDLYYRLNVVKIEVPPLRQRTFDLDLLIDHFLTELAKKRGEPSKKLSKDVRKILHVYSWPGNVRELYFVLERMLILTQKKIITVNDLPKEIEAILLDMPETYPSLEAARIEFHRNYLSDLLRLTQGSVRKAAEIADLPRPSLSRILKKYDIKNPKYRK